MIKFGTGGWRAIIGDEFTKENIQILAKAVANKMIAEDVQDKGIVLGYDRRFLHRQRGGEDTGFRRRHGLAEYEEERH